jgi:hypothetical protein
MGLFRATTGVAAVLAALLLGGRSGQALESATEAPYPLPAADQKAAPKPVHGKHVRPARLAPPTHVPLPPVRSTPRQASAGLAPVSKPAQAAIPEPRSELPAGWRLLTDPATGVSIALPVRLFTQTHDAPHGTVWSSPHGEVQVETFRVQKPDWKALFERMRSQPANRRAQSSDLQDDRFSISGTQGLKDFAVRASRRDGEARGFSIVYDQAMEGIVAPMVTRMTDAFTAFPEASAPFALPSKAVEYGTGIVVSGRGDVVTGVRLTQGCTLLLIAGIGPAERIATERDIALLRVFGGHQFDAAALPEAAPVAGPLRLIGIPDPRDQSGGAATREIPARLSGNSAIALERPAPMAGFAGAAALDAQGRLAGLVEMAGAQLASNAPAPSPLRLVDAAAIRGVLDAHGVLLRQSGGSDPRKSVVRVICVRK